MDSPPNRAPEGDLLYGAKAIAAYLGVRERQARHLIEHGLPHFKLGAIVVARRSTLDAWLDRLARERARGHEDDGATRSGSRRGASGSSPP